MMVLKQEELCQNMESTLVEYGAKLDKLKEACSNKLKLEQLYQSKMNDISEEIEIIQNDLNHYSKSFEESRQNFIEKKEIFQNHSRLIRKNQTKLERLKKDIEQLEEDISERTES